MLFVLCCYIHFFSGLPVGYIVPDDPSGAILATSTSRSLFPASRQMPKLRKMSHPTPAVPSVPLANRTAPSGGLGCNEEISDDGGEENEKEEEEAECSASQCKKPIADAISWVQCDLCQEWFHCSCVGLTKEYAEKIDKYNCTKCLDRVRGGGTVGVASSYGGRGSVGGSGGGRRDHATASSGGNGAGGAVKMKQPANPPTSSGSHGAPSSRVLPATTHELVKGILQNPQLAAQLLSTMPPLK